MMQLPHLTFLRSFEAAARHMSFTGASDELGCTQSAVSNHVRSLETYIGRPLFVRHSRSLSLTDVGEAYLPAVRHALQEIDNATKSLITNTHKRDVVISCPVSLAANWLPEVISRFSEHHENMNITLHGTIWTDVDENVSDISISVVHVDKITPDLITLWTEYLTVLCAPDYRVDGEPMTHASQLTKTNQIQVLGRSEYWELVMQALNLDGTACPASSISISSSSSTNLALEMAARGLGCVVAPKSLARIYMDRGLLVEPFPMSVPSPWTYCVHAVQKNATPAIRQFREWLLAEAENQRKYAMP